MKEDYHDTHDSIRRNFRCKANSKGQTAFFRKDGSRVTRWRSGYMICQKDIIKVIQGKSIPVRQANLGHEKYSTDMDARAFEIYKQVCRRLDNTTYCA